MRLFTELFVFLFNLVTETVALLKNNVLKDFKRIYGQNIGSGLPFFQCNKSGIV